MPSTLIVRAWKEPTPAAMKMVLVMKRVPAEVSTLKRLVFAALDGGHFLAQVEGRLERLDLLEQVVGQFLAGADGHGRDVVDRLVRIQLHALAADGRQRIDHVGLDFQQAQLEHLEQADRARADDHGIGFDGAGKGAVGSDGARFGVALIVMLIPVDVYWGARTDSVPRPGHVCRTARQDPAQGGS
jgi:hypothetical protein